MTHKLNLNDRAMTRLQRREQLDTLASPKSRGLSPPSPQDWGVYEVEVRFPDHPDIKWSRWFKVEVAAVSPEVAAKKAIAHSRLNYEIRTRIAGDAKNARRVKVKRFPGPRHVVRLPSPRSAQTTE